MKKTPPSQTARGQAAADEPMLTELLRLLDAARGLHNFMAQDSGVSQAVISRTYLRAAEPRITSAEKMLAWLRANQHRFDEIRAERLRNRRRPASRLAGRCDRLARFDPTQSTNA